MTSGDLSALVTAFGASIGAVIAAIAALINARHSAQRIDEAQRKIEKLESALEDANSDKALMRSDIQIIGLQLSNTRSDAAKMALLIDQVLRYYKQATGSDLPIDIEMIERMREIYYITGELPRIDREMVRHVHNEP